MDVGNDPENEVLIFGGSGDQWIAGFDPEMARQPFHEMSGDVFYDQLYHDATKLLEAFIFNIEIPTIACINGPGLHTEFALLGHLKLSADATALFARHFRFDLVPGGGLGLTFQVLSGPKRAVYGLSTPAQLHAQLPWEVA